MNNELWIYWTMLSLELINDYHYRFLQEVNPDEQNLEKKDTEEEETFTGPDWMRCSPADLYFRRDKDVCTM